MPDTDSGFTDQERATLHELAAHFVAGKRTVKALVYIIFLLGALTTIAAGAVTLFHRGGN
jgi:hypothetical protein